MVQAVPSRLPKVLQALPEPPQTDAEADLAELEHRLGYAFHRRALLRAALTLGSWANEHPDAGWPSNACLEFFGDAVLGLLAADALWCRFPELDEGRLTRLRASVVDESSLAAAARRAGLGGFLFLGKGEIKQGKREHVGTLADAMEAVLAAVFLDARQAGLDPLPSAGRVFDRLFADQIARLQPDDALDPKSRLQQWAQGQHRVTPTYVRLDDTPSPHRPQWRARVELRFGDGRVEILGEGEARTLKAAERAAASAALARLANPSTKA